MFTTLKNAFKEKEIRTKLFITLGLLFLYILGTWLPIPGINEEIFTQYGDQSFLALLNGVSGGALSKGTLFALGVSPYITASIIIQLLAVAIPSLERLTKQGEEGRKKINTYTRICALILAIAQAVGIVVSFSSNGYVDTFLFGSKFASYAFVVVLMVAGAMLTVWLGEKITEIGVGNGLSLLIFMGILQSAAVAIIGLMQDLFSGSMASDNIRLTVWSLVLFAVVLLIIFALIVFIDGGIRNIPVTYAKQVRGRKLMGGQSTDLPLKVNSGGVMPIIFASALLSFPQLIMSIFAYGSDFYNGYEKVLGAGTPLYSIILCVLIFVFARFYSQITFNPEEVAKHIQENGGMIAAYRPGKPTVEYLRKVNNRLVDFGALFLAFIALIPTLIFTLFTNVLGQTIVNAFTATGMLIIVSVALEFNKGLEEQLIVRNYKGFLK